MCIRDRGNTVWFFMIIKLKHKRLKNTKVAYKLLNNSTFFLILALHLYHGYKWEFTVVSIIDFNLKQTRNKIHYRHDTENDISGIL